MIFLMMIDTPEEKRKFVILYEKYRYLMQKVATDILRDCFLAEDTVHDAFMHLAKNMGKVDETDSVATKRYLITITKNAAIDIYRKESHRERRVHICTDGQIMMVNGNVYMHIH